MEISVEDDIEDNLHVPCSSGNSSRPVSNPEESQPERRIQGLYGVSTRYAYWNTVFKHME